MTSLEFLLTVYPNLLMVDLTAARVHRDTETWRSIQLKKPVSDEDVQLLQAGLDAHPSNKYRLDAKGGRGVVMVRGVDIGPSFKLFRLHGIGSFDAGKFDGGIAVDGTIEEFGYKLKSCNNQAYAVARFVAAANSLTR